MQAIARQLTSARNFTILCLVVVVGGYLLPLQRFITPSRGAGYILGIVGGSMMLVVLLYPLRKYVPGLGFMGTVPAWFRAHMVLGTVGPILVLFHSTFSLGATNSNVALICMLLVCGSGIIGRYFYGRVYDEFHGRQSTLSELKAVSDTLHKQTSTVEVLPDMLSYIEQEEKRLFEPAHSWLGRIWYPFTIGYRSVRTEARMHRTIRRMVAMAATTSRPIAWQQKRLSAACELYAKRRLDARRRVLEYSLYAKVFSFWHVLHVPLFILLLIAGTVHVIAVHVY